MKITFTGDILCYASQDAASLDFDGTYNYNPIFEQVKPLFKNSDYVVGSLETTLSGKDAKYTNGPISFNTPDCFARTLKDAGFDMLTTSNNHCWDRGEDGLKRTLKILNDVGIDHTGTRQSNLEPKYIVRDINGNKIAFLSYTFDTNYSSYGKAIPIDKEELVNFTRQPNRPERRPIFRRIIGKLLRLVRKKKMPNGIILDCVTESEITTNRNTQYEKSMLNTIRQAKLESDIVIMCLHSGGQFNSKIGTYTNHLFEIISSAGADVIITNHAHTVLPIQRIRECIIASALGNFSFAPGEGYYVDGVLSDYSVLLNLHIQNKKIEHMSFTICKSIFNPKGLAITVPVFNLYQQTNSDKLKEDVRLVIKRFCGIEENRILPIYDLNI